MSEGIEFFEVSKSFMDQPVLDGLSFRLAPEKFHIIVGESGSGKTTTLKLINGLTRPERGKVKVDGREIDYSHPVPLRRKIGYSIQGSGLFPHMTVYENLSLVAKLEGKDVEFCKSRADELMELVNLDPAEVLAKYPRQLSGGQKQRIGIARALFLRPKIMLMDEPFGALDPITRDELQDHFLDLQKKLRLTVVMVTHDISEAFKMGNEILLLKEGKLGQQGRPYELLMQPENKYVEEFMRSHSPAHLLKNVYLYAVSNNNLLATYKDGEDYKIWEIGEGEVEFSQQLHSIENVIGLHTQKKQKNLFFVSKDGVFSHQCAIIENSMQQVAVSPLRTRQNILHGLNELMRSRLDHLPVVDEQGVLYGVFSEEAIRAIN